MFSIITKILIKYQKTKEALVQEVQQCNKLLLRHITGKKSLAVVFNYTLTGKHGQICLLKCFGLVAARA